MKKILVLMPFFMGYENKIYEILKFDYEVTLINSDEYDQCIISDYFKCSKFHWFIRHLISKIELNEKEESLRKNDEKINVKISDDYDIVFCINGGYLSINLVNEIRRKNPKAEFILYLWDDVDNLFSSAHVDLFDKVYSYNILDCKKNSWSYLPMFVQHEYIGHKDNKFDIAFIGTAHSDRLQIANDLYNKYSELYSLFIYLYDKNDSNQEFCFKEPLSYDEYLDVLSKSKAVLDLPAAVQNGPTTRVFDALLTETKVISTNQNLKVYPVYSNNILIINRDDLNIDESFLSSPYERNDYLPYTVGEWIKQIGL